MTTFTIDTENAITAFANAAEAAAASPTPFDSFSSEKELAELVAGWPAERLVATFNSLPGVARVKSLKNPATAASRIWKRIQNLGRPQAQADQPAQPKAGTKAKRGARAAKGAPANAKATKNAPSAKNAPKTQKVTRAQASAGPREGSKTAQVVAMLQRKNGATLSEIVSKMNWQRHTVRGFMAGAMKKAGYTIESFKPNGGERTYRINK